MNSSNFILKKDQAEIADIVRHLTLCSDSFVPPLHTYVDIPVYAQKIYNHANTYEFWKNNELIGLLAIYMTDCLHGNSFITNVSVVPEYQGKEIALYLVKEAIQSSRLQGFRSVDLQVDEQNLKALRLYEKLGFHPLSLDNGNNNTKRILRYEIKSN